VKIPIEIREELGLLPDSEVEFEVEGARCGPEGARSNATRTFADRTAARAFDVGNDDG
jgi:bifunctional DNA-binding transcriptional regulator/antitoxin component of YhaV-PrlF toxin-antitoxin module